MNANAATAQHRDSGTSNIHSKEEEPTPRDGWTMLKDERLWKVAKSYGITKGRIALVVSFLVFCVLVSGFLMGIRFDRSRIDVVDWGHTRMQMVGMAQMPDNPSLFIPVYKNRDQILREGF